ncbi:MAG: DUF4345 family protein [Gemmatimonadetes bacterium]|nr:DUF4345 family protein [Gemmatimonadota bacterium]
MTLARVITALNGMTFGLTGIAFLVAPTVLAATVDLRLDTPVALNEIRAFYGGMEVGLGTFLLYVAVRGVWLVPALTLQVLIVGGTIFGRLFGIVLEGAPGSPVYSLLAIETVMLLAPLVVLARLRSGAGGAAPGSGQSPGAPVG